MLFFLKNISALCRLPIALMTAYSAFAGCLLASPHSFLRALGVSAAVCLLSSGASALNQIQEQDIDKRMERTRNRPLPAGMISRGQAAIVAILAIAAGLGMLSTYGKTPLVLGLAALAWYNGVYTPLKRITAFAAIPGGLVGMIPPAIGWSAFGAPLSDPRLIAVSLFFFLWQVPHFWLQLLHHGEEYERAGLPSLPVLLGKPGVCRLTHSWIAATAVSALLLPLYGAITLPQVYYFLVPAAAVVIITGFRLVTCWTAARTVTAFRLVNLFLLFVLSLLSIQGLF